MDTNESRDFQAVLRDEIAAAGLPENTEKLTGLAFSGGGVRSATFNLGIIQSLARNKLLGKFDYLSTVSGGGYIGSWLSAQIHRQSGDATKLKVERFQDALKASLESGAEAESIKWLRSYSNYLTPRKGLSGDTLAAMGTWLRNTSLNQITLSLFFISLMLLPQLVLLTLSNSGWLAYTDAGLWLRVSIALIFGATLFCAISLPKSRCCSDGNESRKTKWQLTGTIIMVSVLAAYSLSLWMYLNSFKINAWDSLVYQGKEDQIGLFWQVMELDFVIYNGQVIFPILNALDAYWPPSGIAIAWAFIYTLPWLASQIYSWFDHESKRCSDPGEEIDSTPFRLALGTIMSALAAGAFGGWLIYLLSNFIARQDEMIRLWWASGFGVPLLLVIFCSAIALHQGLMGRLFRVSQIEWWARLGGYVLLIAVVWAGIHALLIYAPPLLNMLEYKFIAAGGLVWAAHSLGGILFGKGAAMGEKDSARWKEIITGTAPYIFVLGYLVAASWVVHALMYKFGTAGTPYNLNLIVTDSDLAPSFGAFMSHAILIDNNADIVALWWIVAALGIAAFTLACRLDVNLFSIHHFYRNRLTRCYLGAGRGNNRILHPFTGFDPCDDIKFAELKQRPLHLVNTALNLVHDSNLAWQDRKAFSFTFSPVACGFQYPPNAPQQGGGYYHSAQYMGGVKLGTAMAASGAAASPNMGYHSTPAVAFLLTIFNVRLGHWCPNTKAGAIRQSAIRRDSPRLGGEYLLKELFGITNDKNAFLYLSDGGHFENLGVYELVRRRCRYIMVVDAGQDEERNFEDLAGMIRKCHIDFGVDIAIRLDDLRRDGNGNSKRCYTLGDIIYPAGDGVAQNGNYQGVLLYIKPSLLDGIPEDILQYAKANKEFPHQATSDQFFEEAQFESYRHLGSFLMDEVLKSIDQQKTPAGNTWSWG